jgi:quercetin dioxygenase-like cupin family protein
MRITAILESACVAALCLGSAPAWAQSQNLDSPVADAAHHKVEFENEYVRVVRYVIGPHDKTALHDHPNLVNVLLTDLDAKVTAPDGKVSELHGKAGAAAWRGPTVHLVENLADRPIVGILVEPKKPGPAGWTAPPQDAAKLDPEHHKVEVDNEWVRVERYQAPKGAKLPMHSHPTGVQIALTGSHVRYTMPDGKTKEAHTKAGEARYREALSHAVEDLGDGFSGLLIAVKAAPEKSAAK